MGDRHDLWPARLTVRYSDPGDKAYLEVADEDLSEAQWANAAAAGLMMRVYEDSTPEFQAELLGGCWAFELDSEDPSVIHFRGFQSVIDAIRRELPTQQFSIIEWPERVFTQEEMTFLQERAEEVAGLLYMDDLYVEGSTNRPWDVYDPMRSSSGLEYVMSPRSTGFYGVAGGKYLKVEISYVTDPETIEELKQEFGEPDDEHFLAHKLTGQMNETDTTVVPE